MTKEQIKGLTEEQVEARAAELAEAAKADGADLEAIEAETLMLEERRAQLIEQRKADAAAVAAGAGEVIEKREEKKRMKTIEEIRASREYEEAYARYIKTGDKTEIRTLITADDGAQNGVPIPTYLENRIETSWNDSRLWSAIRRKMSTKGIVRVPIEMAADPAVEHTEGAERPAEENITFATALLEPKMLKKWIQITDEVLSLSGREFLDYIFDEIEYQIVQAAEKKVLTSISDSADIDVGLSTTVSAEGISATTVLQALATLADGARNPVAIMNKSVFYEFMALTDLQQRPIFNVISENGRPVYSINGVEVIFADVNGILPEGSAAGTELFFVGDLDGLIVNLPNGDAVDIVYDPYTKAPDDLVTITGKMMMAAAVVKKGFFCAVYVTPSGDGGGADDGGDTGGNS